MSDVQTPQPKQRQMTDREAAIEAIRQQRNADFKTETGIEIVDTPAVIDPDLDPETAAAEAERARLEALANGTGGADDDSEQLRLQREQADAAQRELTAAAANAAAATVRAQEAAGIDPQAKRRLKVNGQEVEMTIEEMEREVQKGLTADIRLRQIAEERRQLEEQQRQLQQQAAAAPQAKPGVGADPTVTKKFTSALFAGDEEQATQAFNEAVSSAVQAAQGQSGAMRSTPDPAAIAVQVRQQIAIDSALERSRSDYPELYSDPDIEALAASKITRKVETEGLSFVDALGSVQDEFAAKFGWKKAARTPTSTAAHNRREDKLARKESLDLPVGGPNVKTSTQEEQPASVHDTIREMARLRGQAV